MNHTVAKIIVDVINNLLPRELPRGMGGGLHRFGLRESPVSALVHISAPFARGMVAVPGNSLITRLFVTPCYGC